ncbi:hypothetical protein [Rhizohabitans arisaemae]|uniref:hypothetical protein n=1 Tax=Rhizohabitans arisaemae TaxID=2720610 RepID=UPI0024B1B3FE|nr:hypothetical protein [Rhizohabitans arisaemae]
MPRRRTDWFALLAGLLLIAVGLRYLLGPEPDPFKVLPVFVVCLGFAGFIGILTRYGRKR